ncbi:MAG: HEAT repeat domain-containing protein, partial [Deltaproteobacteria bacterium]|nr:HEAT repeat domain-containing protein [Deltaproteobacteria bacterium]
FLKKAMADVSWRVRKSAVSAAISFKDAEAISQVARLMVDVLHSEDNAGLRNSAVEGLTRLGIKAVAYLIQNLHDKDHDVRKFIAEVLTDIGAEIWTTKKESTAIDNIVDALINAAKDPDENVRLSAIEGLGKIGGKRVVDILLDILDKGDITLKFTTLEALGNIGKPIPMRGVYNACGDKLLKRAAYDLIGKVGGREAIPYLIDGLKENSTSSREAAVVALKRLAASAALPPQELAFHISQFTSSTIEKIASSLKSHDANVKKGVVFILGLSGKREAVLPLIKTLSFDETVDESQGVLIKLGEEAVDEILDVYQDQDEKIRALLCSILGEIGNKKSENVLMKALKDTYGHVRANAALAIAKINPERALPEVMRLLQDEFDDVRNAAVDAMCAIARTLDRDVTPYILPLLSADDPYVREKAVVMLERIGGIAEIEKVRLALKDDSPVVRKAAVHAIERCSVEGYAQDIILALADEDRDVRIAAAMALGNLRTEKAVEHLLSLLEDEDIWVKATTIESLGKIGKGSAIKAIKGFVDDENGMIVCAALEAMARIIAQEPSAVEEIKPWVAKCISHNDSEIIKVAIDVLGRTDREGAVSDILPLLEHNSWDVRAKVVDILSGTKNGFIRNCLETRLKIETDDLVRQKIAEALKGQ